MIRMKYGESIADYFSSVIVVVNKMCTFGDKSEEILVVEKIL